MSQQRSKTKIASIVLAVIVALLFWSELIFSNLPSLADVATPAATLDWTIGATRLYFIVLAVLDVIGGVGATLYSVRAWRSADRLGGSVRVTTVTLIVYSVYQFVTAFRLPTELQMLYWAIGIVYVLMGIGLHVLYWRG